MRNRAFRAFVVQFAAGIALPSSAIGIFAMRSCRLLRATTHAPREPAFLTGRRNQDADCADRQEIPFFQILIGEHGTQNAVGRSDAEHEAKNSQEAEAASACPRSPAGRQSPVRSAPAAAASLPPRSGEIVRKRAEVEAAIAEARKSHERLREAIDILPQGIVFLDAEGRYILWNKKYAEIYNRSSDLFEPGARLEDTIRIGVERGDYPEAIGREEEWIAERLDKALPARRTARADAGRRPRHPDRGAADRGRRRHRPARRYHRTEAARGVVPAAVRQQSGADDRLRARRRAHSRRQRCRDRALRLQPRRIREADDPQPAGLRPRTAVDRRPLQRRADGADLEACQGRRHADRSGDLFAPARLRRPAGDAAGADGHHRAQARRGAAGLHGPA